MHIGIDGSRLAVVGHTGTERYSYEVIGGLARLASCSRSMRCTLYCNGIPAALPPLGTRVALRNIPFPRLWTHLRLAVEMARYPPEVLFVPSHVVPLIHPRRTVVTLHDLGYLVFPEAHTPARRVDLHLSTLWSVRAAHHIIAVSRATRDALCQVYRAAAPKITVVHHGVAPMFRPITDQAAIGASTARYGIAGEYILYVGTVQPRKNLIRLIDSFAQMVQETLPPRSSAPLHLVIAGKRGWRTEAIEQRAAGHGIAERVHFTGYVDDTDMPALMSGALAFAFPSLYEGFGMPVLEAMACGTPVLTSTTSSLPEVAGDAALLVDPHDTAAIAAGLARLVDDAPLREHLRQRGLERAARFSWSHCAEETLRVLTKSSTR
jgi:glycosyltransferase involved in cell wall biosynthesis